MDNEIILDEFITHALNSIKEFKEFKINLLQQQIDALRLEHDKAFANLLANFLEKRHQLKLPKIWAIYFDKDKQKLKEAIFNYVIDAPQNINLDP